ncbi:hypothetical protein [Streptomyces albidoflavus]|uniref:hypothetical protein n=1 Tax=Streptomyces albidoflavus TaxID=1886 RepID=UPI0033F537F2
MTHADFDGRRLRRVTLTYMPIGGFPQDRHFDDMTPDDLAFVLAALHGRKRRDTKGRAQVVKAMDEARAEQMRWYADQMRSALWGGLGWWRHLVPTRVLGRITDALLDHYWDTTAQWSAELADLHAQTHEIARRVEAVVPRKVAGPRLLCGHLGCLEAIPLDETLTGLPLRWSWSKEPNGGLRCPRHGDVASEQAA